MQHERLTELIDRHCPGEGATRTAAPGLSLVRRSGPLPLQPVVYRPCVCIVAQQAKHALLGSSRYTYDASRFLVLSVPLPLECEIPEATPERPYLALVLDIDVSELSSLLLELQPPPRELPVRPGICTSALFPELLDAAIRLVSSLGDPAATRVLAPMAIRAMLFHLLRSDQGAPLQAVAQQNPYNHQIARVIDHMQARYAEPMAVDALAQMAHMSESSFFAHFKAVTGSSPLQYLKSIRLHEARRLMLAESAPASDAAYRVGYTSASQFSREFKRLFGASPRAELRRLRTPGPDPISRRS